jgi:competence ComEA-like helix-hairpin-helix protein
MKNLLLIVFLFITIPSISALCESSQIDINTASEEELDKLYGIGPVKAQAIIDSRPFDSIDDLIKTNGIGEVTLNKIKEQDLACVDGEENSNNVGDELNTSPKVWEDRNPEMREEPEEGAQINPPKNIEVKPILLTSANTQDIKTENDVELGKTNYAFYGFILFCILIAFLFFIRRKKFKNEFR